MRQGKALGAKMGGTYDDKSDALGVAWRTVTAVFGAVALLSQIKDFNIITWQENFANWIDAFRALTRPVATILFGWIPAYFHLSFPGWVKDYIVVGLVTLFASFRMAFAHGINKWPILVRFQIIFVSILAWPMLAFFIIYTYFFKNNTAEDRRLYRIFSSVFFYALLIMVLNYAFVAAGAKIGG